MACGLLRCSTVPLIACCLPELLPAGVEPNLLTEQQKIVSGFSSSCHHGAFSFSDLLLKTAGQRGRFESGFEGPNDLAQSKLQVWSRSTAARVIDQSFVEAEVDAWRVEFEELIQERNRLRRARIGTIPHGVDLV